MLLNALSPRCVMPNKPYTVTIQIQIQMSIITLDQFLVNSYLPKPTRTCFLCLFFWMDGLMDGTNGRVAGMQAWIGGWVGGWASECRVGW